MKTPESISDKNLIPVIQQALALLYIGERYFSSDDKWEKLSLIALSQTYPTRNINQLTGEAWPLLFPSPKSISDAASLIDPNSPDSEQQISTILEEIDAKLYQENPQRRYDPLKQYYKNNKK